ncbi:MAG: RHS repeat-associated core domain-containing protein, partial [Acidobacteria bacterium]|nr:RHS repeat-associated core domain-containing protein [Acidobacteriota bacterium]
EKLRQTDIGIASYYFLQDHLGSTSALTNSSGTLIGQPVQYEAFGASAGSSLTPYGYTGREVDSLTGLMHYRSRWYDPQQGRFMSEDPIGFEGGLNLYGYAGNNPMMY